MNKQSKDKGYYNIPTVGYNTGNWGYGNQLINLIEYVSEQLGLTDYSIVEKDLFVTRAIHAIAEMKDPHINLVFCGGTCLAKAHQIVTRMSEDVDFKIFPTIPFISSSEQRRKLHAFRESITTRLSAEGFDISAGEGEENPRSRDNNSYMAYKINYRSHFEQHSQLRTHIQLEFTLATPRLPTEIKPVISLIHTISPEANAPIKHINCISILETSAEKWVALTRRIAAISRGHDHMDETLVRHLYDLQSIFKQTEITESFIQLTADTVNRDRQKFKRHHQYVQNPINEIQHSLEVLASVPNWRENYNNFLDSMVFGKQKPSFDICYENLKSITEQVLTHPQLQKSLSQQALSVPENIKLVNTPIFSKRTLQQIHSYVEMQVKLTHIIESSTNLPTDDPNAKKQEERAKQLKGRSIKAAKDILAIPEVTHFLSKEPLIASTKSGQAKQIYQRLQENTMTEDDIKLVLQHTRKIALLMAREIDINLKL